MSNAIRSFLAIAVAALCSGCGESGVGDPCLPEHPPLEDGGTQCPGAAAGSSCFVQGEIYLETRSLQCRTRVCMVYHWNEKDDPNAQAKHVFCTCRCGGTTGQSNFCTCPSDFRCTTAFVAGDPGIIGSYCVRCDALGGCDGGT